MSDTPSDWAVANPVTAVVVSVTYGGHDSNATIDSWWGSLAEAEVRAGELTKANEEYGDESHFAIEFLDTPMALLS